MPPGAPTTGNFSFNFNFVVPPGTTAIQVKPIITGKVELMGGAVFYPPVFPCATDMANVPAMNVPLPVPDETLTLPPMSSDLGCKNITYNFVPGGAVPQALVVDSGGNGVLELGETATVAPAWRHSGSGPLALDGTASGFDGPAGLTYTIPDIGAGYGTLPPATTVSCDATPNCYAMTLSSSLRVESLRATGGAHRCDVPGATVHGRHQDLDAPRRRQLHRRPASEPVLPLHRDDLPPRRDHGMQRDRVLPGKPDHARADGRLHRSRGASSTRPASHAALPDVPPTSPFYRFIDRMAVPGITGGCGGGNYCPTSPVTREQMAAFIIRALGEFDPPLPPTQRFPDVPPTNPFYRFIERMAVLGITSGCGGGNYCPADPVTREQMSVFLSTAFGLTLYGP